MQETRGVAVLAESAPVARRDDGLGRLLRVVELPRTRRLFAQEAPVHATARRGHGSRAWHIALLGGSQLIWTSVCQVGAPEARRESGFLSVEGAAVRRVHDARSD